MRKTFQTRLYFLIITRFEWTDFLIYYIINFLIFIVFEILFWLECFQSYGSLYEKNTFYKPPHIFLSFTLKQTLITIICIPWRGLFYYIRRNSLNESKQMTGKWFPSAKLRFYNGKTENKSEKPSILYDSKQTYTVPETATEPVLNITWNRLRD